MHSNTNTNGNVAADHPDSTHFVALFDKPSADVGSKKARTSSNQNPLNRFERVSMLYQRVAGAPISTYFDLIARYNKYNERSTEPKHHSLQKTQKLRAVAFFARLRRIERRSSP